MAATLYARSGVLRHSSWDGLLIALSALHAALLLTVPSVPLVAVGLWWNANTISHNFIHRPFFRSRRMNRLFAIWLSVVLGFPQSLWRARHLRHHAETYANRGRRDFAVRPAIVGLELGAIVTSWVVVATLSPRVFFWTYLPGWAIGLGLCQMQGHFEHVRGTTSHYGRLYNWLFFNDGYHVEHHQRPAAHWTRLAALGHRDPHSSRWPPVLRWLEAADLELLERLVLRSRLLQRFVVGRHERAFRALVPRIAGVRRIVIVGGGLFPRTALILRRMLPEARLTIIDASARNLETARAFVGEDVEFIHARFAPHLAAGADLVVVPLAFSGDRGVFYRTPPAPAVIVHDWMWSRHGRGSLVSFWLLKRINLVIGPAEAGPYVGPYVSPCVGPYVSPGVSHCVHPEAAAGFSQPLPIQR